jgi:hypothetical protein
MTINNVKIGWMMTLGSLLWLAATNRLGLLLLLIPIASVLAYGFFWLGHKDKNAPHSIK